MTHLERRLSALELRLLPPRLSDEEFSRRLHELFSHPDPSPDMLERRGKILDIFADVARRQVAEGRVAADSPLCLLLARLGRRVVA